MAASTVKNVITETITVEGEADEDGNPGLTTQTVAGSSHDYYLYIEDAKGSTVNVLDSAGFRVVSYLYDDFGDVTESKATGYSGFENEQQGAGSPR